MTTDFDGDARGTSTVYIGADALTTSIGQAPTPVSGINMMPMMMLLEEE